MAAGFYWEQSKEIQPRDPKDHAHAQPLHCSVCEATKNETLELDRPDCGNRSSREEWTSGDLFLL